jgi:hypothetical protein
MSNVFDLAGIVKAMAKATEFVGGNMTDWQPVFPGAPEHERQAELLTRLHGVNFDLAQIPGLSKLLCWSFSSLKAEKKFNTTV